MSSKCQFPFLRNSFDQLYLRDQHVRTKPFAAAPGLVSDDPGSRSPGESVKSSVAHPALRPDSVSLSVPMGFLPHTWFGLIDATGFVGKLSYFGPLFWCEIFKGRGGEVLPHHHRAWSQVTGERGRGRGAPPPQAQSQHFLQPCPRGRWSCARRSHPVRQHKCRGLSSWPEPQREASQRPGAELAGPAPLTCSDPSGSRGPGQVCVRVTPGAMHGEEGN